MQPNTRRKPKAKAESPEDALNQQQLRRLRDSIVHRPPYCQGTLAIPLDDFTLFYGQEGNAHRLNLAQASPEQLQHLHAACQPASFGVNQTDVYDESYRKAGKLDTSDFLLGFDAVRAGIVDIVHTDLVMDRPVTHAPIRAELYKLNVYGQDSFFKAHVDTPRSELQFGSLVIAFPTPHEGGSLMIRQRDDNGDVSQEWEFDSHALLANATSPSIAYVAFYSDAEHEVMPIRSGHRVTITYNLFWAADSPSPSDAAPPPTLVEEDMFRQTLTELLEDPEFLPEGDNLMFGLRHEYPLEIPKRNGDQAARQAVRNLESRLKASDAMLFRVFKDLSLSPELKIIYHTKHYGSIVHVMSDRVLPLDSLNQVEEPVWRTLCDEFGTDLVSNPRGLSWYKKISYKPLLWVTKGLQSAWSKMTFIAYGNQASLGFVYWRICLFVPVGPAGNRTDLPLNHVVTLTHK